MAKLVGGTRIYGNALVDGGLSVGSISVANATAATSTTTGALIVAGGAGIASDLFVGGQLWVTQSSGDEGGQINLAPAVTNTTLVGNVVIDVFQNKLRIFESGGTNRGGYIDLTLASAGVGTNLASGAGGATNYSNVNVAAYLSSATSYINTSANLSVGGNATVGNIISIGSGQFSGQFNESTATAGVFIGNASASAPSPRVGFFNGVTSQNWQIDNFYGTFRWFTPGTTRMSLDPNGNLSVISSFAATSTTTGALTVGGGGGFGGTVFAGHFNTAGNVQVATVNATNLYGTLQTAAQTNITSVGTLASLNVTGNVLTSSITAGSATVNGVINTTGNLQVATVNATNLYGTIQTASQTNITAIGTLGSLNVTGNVLAASFVGGSVNISGNVLAAVVNTTGLNASGTVYANATTQSTSAITGAIVTPGGAGIGANLNVGGVLVVNDVRNSVPYVMGSGALYVAGGASFAKDVWMGGNLYVANIISETTTILTVQDPLLYLQGNVIYPYNYDIGFFSDFTGGPANTRAYTGLVRNDTTSKWYLFSNIARPQNGTVDVADVNLIRDDLIMGNLIAYGNVLAASFVGGSVNVSGNVQAATVNATNLYGTLQTVAQTNITSVGTLTSLTSSGYINTTGNISAAAASFGSIISPTITAINSNVTAANTGVVGYVDSQVSTANTAMKGYVDFANTIQSNAITVANTGVVGYVGNLVTTSNTGAIGYFTAGNAGVVGYVNNQVTTANTGVVGYVGNLVTTSNTGAIGYFTAGNAGVVGYVNQQVSTANIGIIGYIGNLVTTSNTGVVGYVGQQITNANLAMKGYVDNSTSTANIGMKGYVDAGTYLTTYTGNVRAGNVIVSNGVYTDHLYYSNGAPFSISGSGSGITYTASTTAPSTPHIGDLWYDTAAEILFLYENDGVNSYWVDITSLVNNQPLGNANAIFNSVNIISGTSSVSTATGALVVTGGVGVSGNVVATQFIGDGSLLTGISGTGGGGSNYGNANVAQYLPTYSGNILRANITSTISSTSTTTGALVVSGGVGVGGNVVATQFIGDGSLLTGISGGTSQAQVYLINMFYN